MGTDDGKEGSGGAGGRVESDYERYMRMLAAIEAEREAENTARHRAALEIMKRHEEGGYPFALFLRKWQFMVIFGDEEAYGSADDELYMRPGRLEDKVAYGLASYQIPLLTVREYGEIAGPAESKVPALQLAPEDWAVEVEKLIASADLIIYQYDMTVAPSPPPAFARRFRSS